MHLLSFSSHTIRFYDQIFEGQSGYCWPGSSEMFFFSDLILPYLRLSVLLTLFRQKLHQRGRKLDEMFVGNLSCACPARHWVKFYDHANFFRLRI